MNSLKSLFTLLLTVLLFSSCTTESNKPTKWVASWSTAQQLTEPRNNPPAPGLEGNTIRQIVHVSLDGKELRLSLSNKFGTEPVTINTVHVATATDSSAIDPETDIALTFSSMSSITIPPGEDILSDPFDFDLPTMGNMAITMHIVEIGEEITGHPGSRTNSYILEGNHVDAPVFENSVKTAHWYLIDRIDVQAPENAVAISIIGDSITDGRGSGTDKQNRWPDELSKRLQANPGTQQVAVLNQGIGGNCVLKPCLGPAALDRFDRDVLEQPGVEYLIILEGINDIGGTGNAEQADAVAEGLIAAYQEMIEKAHANNIKVYGATILPFAKSFYDAPFKQDALVKVNEWIRTSGAFDAVIDFNEAMTDPENPGVILPNAHDNDFLHPNEYGYRLMAESIDLSLFVEE